MKKVNRVHIADVEIDNLTMTEALAQIEALIKAKNPSYLVNPNIDGIVRCHRDQEFAEFFKGASLSLVDGKPVLWAAAFLGTPLKDKISGSDLVPQVCRLSSERGYRLFFMGGRPGAADQAKIIMTQKYPHLQIVGTYCPPFGFEKDDQELQRMIAAILQAKPDVLFVGLGSPKQERFIKKYYKTLGVPVSMGIGVTFEFIAGIVKRAPAWMQGVGLEWFWRLLMEPGRLWKRYLVDDLQFFPLVLKQKFLQKKDKIY